jgi:hypothetical protein
MNLAESVSHSRRFYRLGAACCIYYVAAQLTQEITFHFGLNVSASGEAEILQRLLPLDQLRAVLILLGFTFVPIVAAYASVALLRYRGRPASSLLGFAFSLLFVGTEASVRSIDLFLISRKWAVLYQAASSEGLRNAIAAQIQIWDECVGALYFGLLGVHLLSSGCFAIARWDREDKWNRIVALGFVLTAVECASRIAESYLGQTWLSGANYAAYFPIVLLNFGSLAIWLWRRAHAVSE